MIENFGHADKDGKPIWIDRGPRVMTTMDMFNEQVERRYDRAQAKARKKAAK